MLDLHPDKFEKILARILQVGHASEEPLLRSVVAERVGERFGKLYPKDKFEAALDKLETLGLAERLLTSGGLKIFITRKGREHASMIEYLSRTLGYPHNELTRPSCSPNCTPTETKSSERDIPIPAPASWNKPTALNSGTW